MLRPRNRALYAQVCNAVVHELGHTRGRAVPLWDGTAWLDRHPRSGLMSRQPRQWTPKQCFQLGRKWAR
jgi:hypothetical protein